MIVVLKRQINDAKKFTIGFMELVLQKDELRKELEVESNREEQAQIQANISRIEREFN